MVPFTMDMHTYTLSSWWYTIFNFLNLLEGKHLIIFKIYYIIGRLGVFLYLITLWIYFVIFFLFLNNFPLSWFYFNSFFRFYSSFLYFSCTIIVYHSWIFSTLWRLFVTTVSRPDILKLFFVKFKRKLFILVYQFYFWTGLLVLIILILFSWILCIDN